MKRDRLKVIYDMLKIIKDHNNSIKPTPLLRFSNLNTKSFNEYMNELLEREFVKEIKDSKNKKTIILTEKGFQYLEKYKTIVNFIDDFGL
jgi:predicted transcriptional regulator